MSDCLCSCREGEEFCKLNERKAAEVRERFRAFVPEPPPVEYVELKARMREASINAEPSWRNVWGQEIDLDDIDREYALNILMMAHTTRVLMDYTRDDFMRDRLIQKLRGIVLEGREPSWRDKIRGARYNARCRRKGLPYRA